MTIGLKIKITRRLKKMTRRLTIKKAKGLALQNDQGIANNK